MAPRTVARNISNLKNKDLLRRVGSNKSGYWGFINGEFKVEIEKLKE